MAFHHAGLRASQGIVGRSIVCGGRSWYHHDNIDPYLPAFLTTCALVGALRRTVAIPATAANRRRELFMFGSHVARGTSHVARGSSHVAGGTSHVARGTSRVARGT